MTERERLIELLNKYFEVGDSDFYICNRVKEAFYLGTMTLDDFTEIDEENTVDIADYLLANGVIVPPCKVGDTVYAMKGCFYLPHATRIKSTDMIPCEIIVIKQTKRNKFILLKPLIEESFGMRSANCWFSFSSLGVTVFLTKEEAEKVLKGGAE